MCVEDIECMNDDPTSVDVLFAKVFLSDSSDRFDKDIDYQTLSYCPNPGFKN